MNDNECLLGGLKSFGGRPITGTLTDVQLGPLLEEWIKPRVDVVAELSDGTKIEFENVEIVVEGGVVTNSEHNLGSVVAGGSVTPNILGGWATGTTPALEFAIETKDQKIARLERDLGLAILRAERAEGHVDRLMTMLESAMEVFE